MWLPSVAAVALGAALLGGGDTAPPHQPGALDVHAWTPYWAAQDALPSLTAHSDALHQVSPFWFRTTGVEDIVVEPNTPADVTAERSSTPAASATSRWWPRSSMAPTPV